MTDSLAAGTRVLRTQSRGIAGDAGTTPAAPGGDPIPAGASESTDLKACCARSYQSDVVALILGESYHPGGLELTRRLAGSLGLRTGQKVLDVASGPGATAFLLAAEFGVQVEGVDLGEQSVAQANAKAAERGIADRVRFTVGDAEQLPLADGSVDAVVCECAFCTFPDKPTAAHELARVLRPGGRLGITDVALDPTRLDEELQSMAGWVACLADARPLGEYVSLLEAEGLKVTLTEDHDEALARMIDQIDARLVAFRMAKVPALETIDFDQARRRVASAARAVEAGIAGYKLLVAEKPL
ncbi:MAG TPA: methyltransferase domain-containing protein [Acidimicrobiales bacterium]|nr:methyltransferase domain-containing protein [Acidimicrobiales bacterium]